MTSFLKIRYASSPSGAGKTHQIVKMAKEMADNDINVLILQPTKELIDKTVRDELPNKDDYCVCVIHGDVGKNDGQTVTEALADALMYPANYGTGTIIFATHQAFFRLHYSPKHTTWHVIVDEEFQVDFHKTHRIPQTHSILTDYVGLTSHSSIYSKVKIKNRSIFKEQGRNKDQDELLEVVAETCRLIDHPSVDSFVNTEHYNRLCTGDGKIKELDVHCSLTPKAFEGFAGVFMVAANFQETLIYKIWPQLGVEFIRDTAFERKLRYANHPNGNLVSIYHFADRNWSRKWMYSSHPQPEGTDQNERRVIEFIIDEINATQTDENFVWMGNKHLTEGPTLPGAMRLPNCPHGLNGFTSIHGTIMLSALNLKPQHQTFLKRQYRLSADEIRTAIYYNAAYQAVLRSSIRNPDDQNRKWIIVPDRGLGEYLQAKLPSSSLEQIDIGLDGGDSSKPVGRPRKYASDAERMRMRRRQVAEAEREMLLRQLSLKIAQNSPGRGRDALPFSSDIRSETPNDSYTNIRTSVTGGEASDPRPFILRPGDGCRSLGSIIEHKRGQAFGYFDALSNDEFIAALGGLHKELYPSKEAIPLISPAVFDPDVGRRRRENILYLNHLYLDFENGDLLPEELPKLFPNVAMIVTNTYNHTADKPRYRVIMFVDQPMSPEGYEMIFDEVAHKLEAEGYFVRQQNGSTAFDRKSGLDWSKRPPNSLFYLPAQAHDAKQSFFKVYNEPGREPIPTFAWIEDGVAPLESDPSDWLGTEPTSQAADCSVVDEVRKENAICRWRACPKGHGDGEFFHLGLELKLAGVDFMNIENTLRAEVRYARSGSQRDRASQIPRIMKSLRSRSRGQRLRASTFD